ncbi:MAG: hypothetical protein AMXMBFR57_16800 [Acidimicrobiia bacterium]
MTTVLVLREVEPGDSERLWLWATDPMVRATAFSPEAIPRDAHDRWFAGRLADPATVMFIAESPTGHPVGQIRFDVNPEGAADVDVTIDPGHRGQGLGRQLIVEGVARLRALRPGRAVRALVKASNMASRRAFEHAGFVLVAHEQRHRDDVCVYVHRLNGDRP